ncbi:MAG: MarR family transcriptional regulator [Candidatus Omnitrophica bacterium]|nr:MarR family transcriptional regulator [Candidatus Omnitrophota bacterium]
MSILRELGVREGKDRINEEVIYSIANAYMHIDRIISAQLAKNKLSPAKFNILLMVKHVGKEKGLAQNEISKLLLVTTSNVTRMIDKLEKEGLAIRVLVKGDRRIKRIKITEKGSGLLDKVWPLYKDNVDFFVGDIFQKSEKQNLINLLSRLGLSKENKK